METFDSQKELEKEAMFIAIEKKDDEDKYILGELLCDAAESGDLDEVIRILDILRESHGVQDADLKGVMHITPLVFASKNGHLPVCEFLLEEGADVNHFVNDTMMGDGVFTGYDSYDTKKTPLTYAAEYGHLPVCIFLVKAGANIELPSTNDGFTPLALASRAGHLAVCEFLIRAGADVNNAEEWSATPLALASYGNYLPICNLLVSSGADINLADQEGKSPLFIASWQGHADVVKMLISNGATIDKRTIDVAKEENYTEIVDILEKWPHSMAILAFEKNKVYNGISDDFTNFKNLAEFMGKGGRRNKKSKKNRNNKKKRKTIRKKEKLINILK
jgi:ankyrin repeat protein